MNLIDSHCHLYLKEFAHDRPAMMDRAKAAGVTRFYLPGIDSEVVEDMLSLEAEYPGECFAMMGLHPCSVKENAEHELAKVEEWLQRRPFVAIGEIGLDFYWDTSFADAQYMAFRQQMEWALQYKLPIVIHSRNAMQECIDTVRPYAERGLKGVFHCFGDSVTLAQQIIGMGFYLGIGGVITYKKSGLAEVVASLPLSALILETDAPYLAPVPFRGKRNESSYLTTIAHSVALAKGTSPEEVAAITSANSLRLFGE